VVRERRHDRVRPPVAVVLARLGGGQAHRIERVNQNDVLEAVVFDKVVRDRNADASGPDHRNVPRDGAIIGHRAIR
jgi:hypothetical protein